VTLNVNDDDVFNICNCLDDCQIQDLHRTGCSGFSGSDNEEDRAVLKRVLLAYARWNKLVGYCQGFNVLAALILDVMDRKEDCALKVLMKGMNYWMNEWMYEYGFIISFDLYLNQSDCALKVLLKKYKIIERINKIIF